tara:strand:+ start:33511 stop:34041 length:531 start_codon:yes stop_codon:yes gene_type:complete
MGRSLVTLWFLFLISESVYALDMGSPLSVIADKGGVAVSTYFDSSAKSAYDKKVAEAKSAPFMLGIFPVRTKAMSVGAVGPEEMPNLPASYQIVTPMFIIGDDPVSLRWLVDNRELLISKKAVGLVVNVETSARMDEIRRTAGEGILLSVSPGDDIAESLGIKHYPFYVDRNGVMR